MLGLVALGLRKCPGLLPGLLADELVRAKAPVGDVVPIEVFEGRPSEKRTS